MAFAASTAEELLFHGYRLTTVMKSLNLEASFEELDDTTLSDLDRSVLLGLRVVNFSASGLFDATNYDGNLYANLAVNNRPITILTGSSAGSVAYFFDAVLGKYSPIKNSIGDLMGFDLAAHNQGVLVRGQNMNAVQTYNSTGNGSAYQVGAVAAGKRMYAVMHVYSATGTTPTLDVIVQSDDNAGFSSPTNRITFSQATGITSQITSVAGAITDDYWRITYTLGGTTPVFGFVVAIGIL